MNPLDVQVGGNHYKRLKIQPITFIQDNFFKFAEGNVLKYLVRDKGNRKEDLEKAYHYLSLIKVPWWSTLKNSDSFEAVKQGYIDDPFFKQFKNGRTYALIVAYAHFYKTSKAKELLRKFINSGEYSEV